MKESIQKVGLVAEELMDKGECDELQLATEAEEGANYQVTFIDEKNISKGVVGMKFYDTRRNINYTEPRKYYFCADLDQKLSLM